MSELASHPAVRAVQQHAANWNARDRAAWLELFDDEVTFEDPVGKAPKRGRVAAEGSWDNSFTEGRVWTLHPQRIIPGGASEAAVHMLNRGNLHGDQVELEGIELYRVNELGLIVSVRAFFEQPTDFELNPFFVPES
jgi:steroid delta-isomerase